MLKLSIYTDIQILDDGVLIDILTTSSIAHSFPKIYKNKS